MSMTTELALLVSKAKASVFTMKYISQFEASDIDSDDVDLRFEVDGVETGTNVSIVDECGQAAQMITALVEALEARDKQIADSENRVGKQNRHVCELFDDNTALRQRIIELEEKLQTSDKLQDSAFRHGLQHGFSLGQTDNQAGFEQCLVAYSQKEKNNG